MNRQGVSTSSDISDVIFTITGQFTSFVAEMNLISSKSDSSDRILGLILLSFADFFWGGQNSYIASEMDPPETDRYMLKSLHTDSMLQGDIKMNNDIIYNFGYCKYYYLNVFFIAQILYF